MKAARWFKIWLCLFLVFLISLVIFAPTLASTALGQRVSLCLVNRFSSLTIKADSFRVSWFHGFDIEGIEVKDAQQRKIATCKRCVIERPLYALLWSPYNLGSSAIYSPTAYIYQDKTHQKIGEDRQKTLKRYESSNAKRDTADKRSADPWIWPKGKIKVVSGRLISKVGEDVLHDFSGLNLSLDLRHDHSSGTLKISSLPKACMSFSLRGEGALTQRSGTLKLNLEKLSTDILELILDKTFPDFALLPRECFGAWLTCRLDASLTNGRILASSSIASDNVVSTLSWELQGSSLTVNEGQWLKGQISPTMFDLLPVYINHKCSLKAPATIALDSRVPSTFDLSSWKLLSPIDIDCSVSPFSLVFDNNNARTVDLVLDGSIFGVAEETKGLVSVDARSDNDSASVKLNIQTKIEDNVHLIVSETQAQGDWPLIAERTLDKPLVALLGPTISGSVLLSATYPEFSAPDLSLWGKIIFSSSQINHQVQFLCTDQELSITQASFDWTVPPSLFNPKTTLGKPVSLRASISDLSFPIAQFGDRKRLTKELSGSVTATLSSPLVYLDGHDLSIEKWGATLAIEKRSGSPYCDILIKSTLSPRSKTRPYFSALFGKDGMNLLVGGRYDFISRSINMDRLDLVAEHLFVNIRDLVVDTRTKSCIIQTPPRISLRVDNSVLSMIVPPSTPLSLQEPAEIRCVISPCTLSYRLGNRSSSKVGMEIACEKIQFANKKVLQAFRVRLPLNFDFKTRELSCSPTIVDATTQKTFLKSSFSVKIPGRVKNFPLYVASGNALVSGLPLSFLSSFLSSPSPIFLDDTFSAKMNFSYEGLSSKNNFCNIDASCSYTSFGCHFILDEMRLKGAAPYPLRFSATLPPSSYIHLANFLGIGQKVLNRPAEVQFSISSCDVDLSQICRKASIWTILESSLLSGKFSSSPIHMEGGDPIPECKAYIDLNGHNRFLRFSANMPPYLNLEGSFEKGWNKSGITLPDSKLQLVAKLAKTPTSLLSSLFSADKETTSAFFGQSVQIDAKSSVENMSCGFIDVDLLSDNTKLHLESIIKEGVLTLKSPATLEQKIDRKAGKALLKDSWFSSAIRSSKPILMRIDPQGVKIPLLPFSVSKVIVPNITIEPDKLILKNKGAMRAFLSILNMKKASKSDLVDVWSTPIYLSVGDGVVSCRRSDLLIADKLHLITWGTIHLKEDRLDLIAAVPQETLKKLRMPIVLLSPERGLQIPITGTIMSPSVDTVRLSTRIAGAKIRTEDRKNPLNIIGGALQVAASLGASEEPIPPPTTHPLPWEEPEEYQKRAG